MAERHVADARADREQHQPDDQVRRRGRSRPRASPRRSRRTAATSPGPSPGTGRRATTPHATAAGRGAFGSGSGAVRAAGGDRQQLLCRVQVGRQEDDDQDLPDLGRLERQRTDRDPQARAVDRPPDPGDDRQQEQDEPEQPDRVRVRDRASGGRGSTTSVSTNAISPTPSHVTCSTARSGLSRQITANPSPDKQRGGRQEHGVGAAGDLAHHEPRRDEARGDQRAVAARCSAGPVPRLPSPTNA